MVPVVRGPAALRRAGHRQALHAYRAGHARPCVLMLLPVLLQHTFFYAGSDRFLDGGVPALHVHVCVL